MSNELPEDLPGAEELFDEAWYRETYPDVDAEDPWRHFVRHGELERRSPGPDFDATFYAGTYLALEEQHALRHYLTRGREAGLLPRPRAATEVESRALLDGVLADLPLPFLLIGNDAQRAGAPLLQLEMARHLRSRGWSPVFLLQRGGPLLEQFRALGPTLVLAEGHHLAGLGGALPSGTPILASTGWAAPVLVGLGSPDPQALLIHEMPDYLEQEGLLEAVVAARVVVTGLPGVAAALTERLGSGVPLRTIVPGLLHVPTGPASTERVRRTLQEALGEDRVLFLGAGYADRRKGFDRFLRLAHQIADVEPRAAFVWLGELSGWARALADQAIADGLPLLLPGFRLDAPAWYDNATLYLLTSRQDPGPTTVMDAARRGTPFVAAPGDLGLSSLGSLLDGVGTFAPTEAEVVGLALEAARAETPVLRSSRARHLEQVTDFPRYVDELLDLLREQDELDEPV